ncbi:unnamed protein product, partial [Amoebophrya sp. A25]
EQQHVCPECSKVFKTRKRLTDHVAVVHTAERAYVCGVEGCGKSFKKQAHLIRHEAKASTKPKPLNFACPHCDKRFCDNQKLKKHMVSHNRLRCEKCGATFKKKGKHDMHIA